MMSRQMFIFFEHLQRLHQCIGRTTCSRYLNSQPTTLKSNIIYSLCPIKKKSSPLFIVEMLNMANNAFQAENDKAIIDTEFRLTGIATGCGCFNKKAVIAPNQLQLCLLVFVVHVTSTTPVANVENILREPRVLCICESMGMSLLSKQSWTIHIHLKVRPYFIVGVIYECENIWLVSWDMLLIKFVFDKNDTFHTLFSAITPIMHSCRGYVTSTCGQCCISSDSTWDESPGSNHLGVPLL